MITLDRAFQPLNRVTLNRDMYTTVAMDAYPQQGPTLVGGPTFPTQGPTLVALRGPWDPQDWVLIGLFILYLVIALVSIVSRR
jgi:hypothetical protein